jgi:hypothetical protein
LALYDIKMINVLRFNFCTHVASDCIISWHISSSFPFFLLYLFHLTKLIFFNIYLECVVFFLGVFSSFGLATFRFFIPYF